MRQIKIIIEKASDGFFSAYADGDEPISGMGGSVEACKKDVLDCIDTLKEFDKTNHPPFLDEEYELIYKFDVESLLAYYKGVINPVTLYRLTGINPKQIHHYASGHRKPRAETKRKIEEGLHQLGEELLAIELS